MSQNKFDIENHELYSKSFILIKVDNFQPDKHTLQLNNNKTIFYPIEFEGQSIAYFIVPPQPQNKEINEADFKKLEGTKLEIIRPNPYHYNDQRSYQLVNVSQISEKPFVRSEIQNQIGEEPYSINGYGNENQHSQVLSYGKESSLINAEPDVIKVIKKNAAFTSTEFDKSIINKLKDKGVTYAIFFDEKKQNEFHSWQLSQEKKIHSNLINTISKNADKQETLEEILCFYENEILYIENNPNFRFED